MATFNYHKHAFTPAAVRSGLVRVVHPVSGAGGTQAGSGPTPAPKTTGQLYPPVRR